MRVLFSTTAGAGHFGPAVPIARACVDAGHEVVVAAPESFAEHVGGAGFEHRAFADVPQDQMAAVFSRLPFVPRPEANRIVISEVFGRLDAQAALPRLTEIVADWRPDLIVRDPCEFAALAISARHGLPQCQVAIGVGQLLGDVGDWMDEPIRELEALVGVAPVRGVQRVHATPTFSSVPPSLDEPAADSSVATSSVTDSSVDQGPVWRYRAPQSTPTGPPLPATWGDPTLPLLYVSFGSVTGAQGRFDELYQRVLDELAGLPVRLLMTTGHGLDPASLVVPSPNAYVTRWWPQEAAMPESALVIGHGGFGTTMTAVRAGVPQIVLPLFASDQFLNAERIEQAGAGLALPGGVEAVPRLASAVQTVLAADGYGAVARALAAEIETLPDVVETVTVLEELARRR